MKVTPPSFLHNNGVIRLCVLHGFIFCCESGRRETNEVDFICGGGGRGTGGIAWRSDLMWEMSLRETDGLQNGVKIGSRYLWVIIII